MKTPVRLGSLAVAIALVATACGTADSDSDSTTAAVPESSPTSSTPSPTPEAEATSATEPSPEQSTAAEPQAPENRIDAGTVANGSTAVASGTGSADVSYVIDGEIAVVVDVDCGACANTRVVSPTAGPFGSLSEIGNVSGSYLLSVFEETEQSQSIWIETEGDWSMTLTSWNDLSATTLPQSGTGPAVLWLDGAPTVATFDWQAASDDDSVQFRYFAVNQDDVVFGAADQPEYSTVEEISLPGVLAVTTEGTWSITPQ